MARPRPRGLFAAREPVIVDSPRRPGGPAEEGRERVLGDGSRHRVHRRRLEAQELAAGGVVHAGDWFVGVARERWR